MSSLNSQDSVPTAEANFAILLTYVRGLRTERSFRCLPVMSSLNSQDSVPTAEANFAILMTCVRGLRTKRRRVFSALAVISNFATATIYPVKTALSNLHSFSQRIPAASSAPAILTDKPTILNNLQHELTLFGHH